MATLPGKGQRYLFIGIVLAFLIVGYAMYWVRNDFFLMRHENLMNETFFSFQKYEDSLELPDLTFQTLDGQDMSLSDYRGKFVLLNLWATWCKPCIDELPSLDNLRVNYAPLDFEIVAVSIDTERNAQQLAQFLVRHDIGPVAGYLDHDTQLQRTLPLRSMPTTFLIDTSGRILYQITGHANWYTPEIIQFFDLVRTVY